MPRIRLKPNSPEFLDTTAHTIKKTCDMPGCNAEGTHKAPKHRGLNEYYYFCSEHITEYNKAWDFFSGMSDTEVQSHMHKSRYGDRPTWKYNSPDMEEKLYKEAQKEYTYNNEGQKQQQTHDTPPYQNASSPEHEAMAVMGLEPPLDMDALKARYKTLAKKYHPDLNKNDPKAEELLKKINMAYTVLKLAFEDYKKLPKRNG